MENNKKKLISSILVTLLIIGGVSTITYAVYKWRSTVHLNVNIDVTDEITIKFDGGPDITGRIYPVSDYTKGIKKSFKIKSNLPSGSTFNLYLHFNEELPEELVEEESFRWMITSKSDNYDNCSWDCGSFHDVIEEDYLTIDNTTGDYLLMEDVEVPYKQAEEYVLYIWLDGENYTQDPSIGGKHIDISLYASSSNSNGTFVEASNN